MAVERMTKPESGQEKPLEKLNSEEIVGKYSSKVKDKDKAEKYLVGLNEEIEYKDGTPGYKEYGGIPVHFISKELLRYISDNNENINFGNNINLNNLPKDEAYAYIAYAQDMLSLEVDGLIGDQTKDKLVNIHKD